MTATDAPGDESRERLEHGKPEPTKRESAIAEPSKSEPSKSEPSKVEPGRVEPKKAESGKSESGKSEAGSAESGRPATRKPAATSFAAEQFNYVHNRMPSTMTVDTAYFGVYNESAPRATRVTGRFSAGDIAEATTAYQPPACHAEAVSIMAEDHTVLLFGPAGTGKRTAALVLLRAVSSDIVLLSPEATLDELAERKYDEATGYAIIDHTVEHTSGKNEFTWRVIRERLSAVESYLVLTATTEPPPTGDAVRRVGWTRPDVELALRKRMSKPLAAADLKKITEALDDSVRMRDVVRLAKRLDQGEPLEMAIDHFDQTSRTAVCDWFDKEPSRRQITEVTTLAFALGTDDRVFESMLGDLEEQLAEHLPEPDSTEEVPNETSLPQRRRHLTGPGSLIVRRIVPSDLGPRGELEFVSPGYHRHVLGQLWNRMEVSFWDAVRGWLDDLVMVDGPGVALGLAQLAEVAFGEVLALLDPWSTGSSGADGQFASIAVLSMMARDDEMAPVALMTATRWITSGDPARRWTAAVALGAELGVRYPHVATNRLWQLCTQAHTTDGDASIALAELFVTLVRETPDAGIVLTTLAGKLDRFRPPGGNLSMYAVAVAATVAVLSAEDRVSDRKSALLYLERFPDRVDLVAKLLTTVLRNRTTRLRAIQALQAILKDLADHDERPAHKVRWLGLALASAMTESDRELLRIDMRRVAQRRTGPDQEAVTTLLTALLNALDRNPRAKEEP